VQLLNLYLFYTSYNSKQNITQCNSKLVFSKLFLFVTFREKYVLVQNDILDCMMEMRKRVEEGAKGDVQNTENAKRGPNFSKI
jgi:hypothetical protein